MSGQRRAYPSYRDSGLPWLGAIPAHWEVRRNGRLFSERREPADPALPLLEVSLRTGVRVRPLGEGARKQAMADRSKYQRARVGDVAYNTMRMWQGAVGVVPADGLISPAYVVVRPYPDVDPRYYAYLFRTAAYLQQVEIESRGIVPDRNRLYWDAFKAMPSAYPPPHEQCAIANYLDAHARVVRRFEHAKQRVAQLLNEQALAVVQHHLPSAPSVALRRVADIRLSGVDKHSRAGELPVRLCNYVDVYRRDRIDETIPFMHATATVEEIERFAVRPGDVIVTKDSESWTDIGVAAFVTADLPGVVCAYHLALIRPDPAQLDGEYLFRMFGTAAVMHQLHRRANGVTRFGLSQHTIKSVAIPLPSVAAQRAACAAIADALAPLDEARARIARELALISEYRMRLVSDVVAGQVDVRGEIPAVPESLSSVDFGSEDDLDVDGELSDDADDALELDAVTSDAD